MQNRTTRFTRPVHTSRLFLAVLVTGFVVVAGTVDAQVLNEEFKILASDGAVDDWFGFSIAIDNGVVAVGAFLDDDFGDRSGSVYLFDASTGTQLFKLTPGDSAAGDEFGWSIAINNGVVAVGADRDQDNGFNSGSAYLFNVSTGAQIAKLLPSDGVTGDLFGWSIAIDNGIVAVGAYGDDDNGTDSGSVYLFDASTGVQLAKLLSNDGAAEDSFGSALAISNGIVAAGAFQDDDNGTRSGSAYLFDASTGLQLAKLLPSDGALQRRFGGSIAIDNTFVVVGSIGNDDNGTFSGAAYLFDVATGVQLAKLLPDDGARWDTFGISIAIDNGVIAIGANGDSDNGPDSGSAYVFDASTGAQITKLLPSDGAVNDWFGFSVDIDNRNNEVAIGARYNDDNGSNSGSAYMFDFCPADMNDDGVVDVVDFFEFVTIFAAGDLAADLDGSGDLDVLDFFAFIIFFAAGCP